MTLSSWGSRTLAFFGHELDGGHAGTLQYCLPSAHVNEKGCSPVFLLQNCCTRWSAKHAFGCPCTCVFLKCAT